MKLLQAFGKPLQQFTLARYQRSKTDWPGLHCCLVNVYMHPNHQTSLLILGGIRPSLGLLVIAFMQGL